MNKKIILAGLLTLASVAGVVGTVGNASKVEAESNKILYLKPSGKETGGAWFAAWTWGGTSDDAWVTFTDNDGDSVYEAAIPSDRTGMKVHRMASGATSPTFDKGDKGYWNASTDITIPANKNCWTWGSTWDGASGSWSSYTPNIYLTGLFNSWNTNDSKYKFVSHNNTEVQLQDIYLNAEEQFKVKTHNGWFGYTSLKDGECKNLVTDGGGNDRNMVVNKTAVYDFYWDIIDNKLWVDLDEEKTAASIDKLFTKYYNEGSYVKETELNVSGIAEEECKKYFHAGALTKYRQTTYKPGELTMVTKSNEGDEWGTQTSTYKDIGNDTGVEHYSNGLKDYTVSGTVNGENRNSVDLWFVTLNDFITSGKTGWSYANGVYTFDLTENTTEMETMAREFIAPMWLKTTEAVNYVTFDIITVEENNSTLIMKLYVDSGNSGQLEEGSNLVFSEAKITKLVA